MPPADNVDLTPGEQSAALIGRAFGDLSASLSKLSPGLAALGTALKPPGTALPALTAPQVATGAPQKPLLVVLSEFSGQAHRELSGAVLSGILAAQGGAPPAEKGAPPGEEGAGGGLLEGLRSIAPAALSTAAALHAIGLAAPQSVEKFKIATEDATAVIGQALAPSLDVVTGVVRLFGDLLANLLPSGDALADVLRPVGELLSDLADALMPLVNVIGSTLTVGFKALGVAVNLVLLPFRILARLIGALFGAEDFEGKTSKGAAVRNVSFTSDQGFAQSVYRGALMTGARPKGEYEGALKQITDILDDINSWVRGIADKLGAIFAPSKPGDLEKGLAKQLDAMGFKGAAENMRKQAEQRQQEALANNPAAQFAAKTIADALREAMRGMGKPVPEEEPAGALDWMRRGIDRAVRRGLDGHPGGGS